MAYPTLMLHTVVILLLFAFVSAQGSRDVLKDVCFRYGHQTAVIDRKLYIDGGLLYWGSTPPPASSTPEQSTSLGMDS